MGMSTHGCGKKNDQAGGRTSAGTGPAGGRASAGTGAEETAGEGNEMCAREAEEPLQGVRWQWHLPTREAEDRM